MEGLDLEGFLRAHEVNSRPWMENLLLEKCNLSTIRPFQLEPAMNLNAGKDLISCDCHGNGKNYCFAHAFTCCSSMLRERYSIPLKFLVLIHYLCHKLS